jgi:hypothetical protein
MSLSSSDVDLTPTRECVAGTGARTDADDERTGKTFGFGLISWSAIDATEMYTVFNTTGVQV